MSISKWCFGAMVVFLGLASLTLLTGASCGDQTRNGVQAAGVDFVKSSTSQALQALFPVKDMLSGIRSAQPNP